MTPSLKALIEQQALNDCVCGPGPCSHKTSYIHGATPYAEKWEAAEQENARINTEHNHLISEWKILKAKKDQLEQENKRLREALGCLIKDVKSKPNNTRYTRALNIATEALKHNP